MSRLGIVFAASLAIAASLPAQGGRSGGATATGADSALRQDSLALPAKVVRDAAAVFNAERTMRLRGDNRIAADSVVSGDVAILKGQLTIAGHIRGRIVAINADVILEPTARVDEDILVIGGAVGSRDNGRVRGDIRLYRTPMLLAEAADSIVPDARYTDEGKWWSRLRPESPRDHSKITVRGDTYNRIEGLPVLIGPSFRHTGELFRTRVDALGIIRTADRARWDSENIGHKVDGALRLNRSKGFEVGASLFDIVDPIETWEFSDHEVGLATFLLHRDFRDYYGRHGGALNLLLFRGYEREIEFSYSLEKWRSRDVRDTWTVFRDDNPWRPNPEVHEGSMHIVSGTMRLDTRNSETNPWSGWLLSAQLEHGQGMLTAPEDPLTSVASSYSRTFLDLRRYSRISPRGQLNMRVVYGARLGGDELPLQKRFSLGGPGSLPGFDFRRAYSGADVGICSTGAVAASRPALCERIALAQLEYRGDISLDLFGSEDRDDRWRDVGRHPGAQWVIFVDAGRGWLLSDNGEDGQDGLTYAARKVLPPMGTFRTDVGAGLDMGAVGVFVAKAVSQSGVPANFFVRLRHRF